MNQTCSCLSYLPLRHRARPVHYLSQTCRQSVSRRIDFCDSARELFQQGGERSLWIAAVRTTPAVYQYVREEHKEFASDPVKQVPSRRAEGSKRTCCAESAELFEGVMQRPQSVGPSSHHANEICHVSVSILVGKTQSVGIKVPVK